ncbi:MAG: hypothetical protein LBQ70_06090 [Prevotellaceae bacterium]|jgi:hypothetical protein|nr:hypothetical protein [Prevotellaceae bacterium]
MKRIFSFIVVSTGLLFITCGKTVPEDPSDGTAPLAILAKQFVSPPIEYRPHVWWHWLGSNFRKEGITKDLEAMKEAGIGGATIFNIASSVQNTHAPIENNPWPEQTFRGEAYWDAFRHTLAEAKRLGLTIGLHGTPGYATTGGPWIPEERGMQTLVFSDIRVTGNRVIDSVLQKPELPRYKGYAPEYGKRATYYRDVAVVAVPDKNDAAPSDVIDISEHMDTTGLLRWQAPKGNWIISRIGHAPTMANPHPLPDDIIGKALEVDKMSREDNIYHWQQLLDPLKEHIGQYFGNTFKYIWIDSYESGDQNWTPGFREEFVRMKGYDPLPFIALQHAHREQSTVPESFSTDNRQVISQLFVDNSWKTAAEMIHSYGLQLYWEPYYGPFNQYHNDECIAIADLPINEFWTGGDGYTGNFGMLSAKLGKRIVAAEAFTGPPQLSRYTEDPAFLKRPADGCYAGGVNLYFLHHWVHQPFDDKYQPGMGMGWWGTHFGRHQTWFRPGKAFFTYLARCQMLLQQGTLVSTNNGVLHRTTNDADIFFITNLGDSALSRTFEFPVREKTPELWDAYRGTIRQTNEWREANGSIAVDLKLEKDESVFVVFPKNAECAYAKLRLPPVKVLDEKILKQLDGSWNVSFQPKLGQPFKRDFESLVDFSLHNDDEIKYFAGTASYETNFSLESEDLGKNVRILLDAGTLNDIAELEVNGKNAGVLWNPPYKTDISPYIKKGNNKIVIHVTNNWANRLIGDEQYPADFEWGTDRDDAGRAMKAFPDWFIKNQARPSERKAFTIWYYYRKDDPLQPAGLLGPVRIIKQNVSE